MTRKILVILVLMVTVFLPSHAVFDENNVNQSIHVLDNELRDKFVNVGKQTQLQRDNTRARIEKMRETMKQSNVIAMMLYSQKEEYIFGLTYASNMAATLYKDFMKDMGTLMQQENSNQNSVGMCDSLLLVLNRIDVSTLSSQAKKERLECIYWAKLIKVVTAKSDSDMKQCLAEYRKTKTFLQSLNNYAQNRYEFVQNKMFHNGSETFYFIVSHWSERWPYLKMVVEEEFNGNNEVPSEWSVSIREYTILAFVLGALLAIALGWLISYFILRSKTKNGFIRYIRNWAVECHTCFILTCGAMIYALVINIIRVNVSDQSFLVMALNLMGAFSWILAAILLSSFFTSKVSLKDTKTNEESETSKAEDSEKEATEEVTVEEGKRVAHSMSLYVGLMFCSLYIIFLRINIFPNIVIATTLPPLILICAIIEPIMLISVWKRVGKIDRVLATITEIFFAVLVYISWNGFILLTVQILTWWMLQLACILVLTSVGLYMKAYSRTHAVHNNPISKTWPYYSVCMLFCPLGAVFSVIMSAYWAGAVFNINELVDEVMDTDWLGSMDVTISLNIIIQILNMWFIARFINFVAQQSLVKGHHKGNVSVEQGQHMMFGKVIQIAVYGTWFLWAMVMLHISTTWIAAAWAGLVTGMGFASKTILENIFYGVSLLSGRLKIGDLIKVGDVYGKVLNISYSSTVIKADDGTVVAFTNEQLFAKNYRNLTHHKESSRELLNISVAISQDIDHVRKIILDATATLPCLHLNEMRDGQPIHKITVNALGIAGGWLNLQVTYWVNPNTEREDIGVVTETVINALKENNIELH